MGRAEGSKIELSARSGVILRLSLGFSKDATSRESRYVIYTARAGNCALPMYTARRRSHVRVCVGVFSLPCGRGSKFIAYFV